MLLVYFCSNGKPWVSLKSRSIHSFSNSDSYRTSKSIQRSLSRFLAIYVGTNRWRFVILTRLLKLPIFVALLNKAGEKFGLRSSGGLVFPCEVGFFKEVLRFLEKDEVKYGGAKAVLCWVMTLWVMRWQDHLDDMWCLLFLSWKKWELEVKEETWNSANSNSVRSTHHQQNLYLFTPSPHSCMTTFGMQSRWPHAILPTATCHHHVFSSFDVENLF